MFYLIRLGLKFKGTPYSGYRQLSKCSVYFCVILVRYNIIYDFQKVSVVYKEATKNPVME